MSLTNQLESFLGEIEKAWKSDAGIRVVRFPNKPVEGTATYVTLGLSDHVLPMRGERTVRQELVFTTDDHYPPEQIASFLLTFAEFVASRHQALLRGDVVGPRDPIIPGVPVNAVYASMPYFFDDGFATYSETTPPTVLVWLMPLHADEARFVKKVGWSKFEDILDDKDPDVWNLERDSVL
jgi:hypothetical protein